MEKLINSSTLVDMLFSYATRNLSKENNKIPIAEVLDMIDVIPVVEAEPVAHAHWEEVSPYSRCGMKCSRCKAKISYRDYYSDKYGYCHNCGAKMDEECNDK